MSISNSMEAPKVSQKEYLKRYLSKDDGKKKRKRKKLKVGPKTVQLIDDDIDFKKLTSIDDDEISILNTTEDAPQIVGIIDERGPIDFADKQRWKLIADDGTGDIAISKVQLPKKDMQETNNNNGVESKIKTKSDLKGDKLKQKISSKKAKKEKRRKAKSKSSSSSSSSSSDSSQSESEDDKPKMSKRKRKKVPLKRKKKTRKCESSSSDSESESDSSSDSDSSPHRSRKKKRTSNKKNQSDSDSSQPSSTKRNNLSKSKGPTDDDFNIPNAKDMKYSKSNSDCSPPRKKKLKENESCRKYNDQSRNSRREKARGHDSDISPPRNSRREKTRRDDSDISPPRNSRREKTRRDDSDISPPRNSRREKTRGHDSDISPPRNSRRDKVRGHDSDLSPPRNSRRERTRGHDSDLSPPRNSRCDKARGHDSDLSPPRNSRRQKDSNRNYSPRRASKRSGKNYDSDLSPPRQSRNKETKASRWDDDSRKSLTPEKNKNLNKKMKKTLDGTSAGLQNLKSLKEEEEAQKKREQAMMQRMSKEVSGYGQSTVIRDRRTGRRRDLAKESLEKLEKQKAQDEIDAKYAQWGKGLKQLNDRNQTLKNDLYEMSKPLARYANDEDLERELKMRDRDDDPMLAYCKKKEIEAGKRAPDNPKFQGSFMPNRFGIPPGYRWDGVDRSNGYEKKWFEARNTKKAVEEEAYKWSTADM